MGAGKTTLVREIAHALGSDEASSPSFAIHQSYKIDRGSLEHLDLFRLESADDLESTGFWDIFHLLSGLVFIEWSERLVELGLLDQLPSSWPQVRIKIEFVGLNTEHRQITYVD
jgi:tRNA threonylcarbamoyl adenosine modification protein YjeE